MKPEDEDKNLGPKRRTSGLNRFEDEEKSSRTHHSIFDTRIIKTSIYNVSVTFAGNSNRSPAAFERPAIQKQHFLKEYLSFMPAHGGLLVK